MPQFVPAYAANPYGAPSQPQQPRGPGPFAPQPQSMPGYGPGAMVLVYWADGNRYPATVLQAAGNQVLVAFPGGQQQWVDLQYVSSGA
jgi:hypothetical protein